MPTTAVIGFAMLALQVHRWTVSSLAQRRTRTAVLGASVVAVVVFAMWEPVERAGLNLSVAALTLALSGIPVAYLAGLLPGPVWRVLNPLRLVTAVSRDRPYPERLGHWPAALGLLAFTWVELVEPGALPWFLVAYAAVNLAGGFAFGRTWFERADGFEVFSTLVGRLSPLRGNPFRALAATPVRPGLVAVVAVLLGSTAFDSVGSTPAWERLGVPDAAGSWRPPPSSRAATCSPAGRSAGSWRTRSCRSSPGTWWRTTRRCSSWRASARCWPGTCWPSCPRTTGRCGCCRSGGTSPGRCRCSC
ncbi:hypothetical protein [Saccharothrix longispora]|uniref:hypothetical protein n=1 Tax=Saccharothrix longispora TaxID=33920 RepID=UPI0028FD1325|nr:hypothetical protein [Saccharothrix longispora]MBY8849038.1 hypothetical protein [Saccharothrix sp. MB29]MDU0290533.1 hypothetical protein [Saccharothrix longispora]